MSTNFLRSSDTISGKEGKATAVIDGLVVDLFYVKNIEAEMEKGKEEVQTVGRRATGHKSSGWTGTGSMTIYYITSTFRKMALQYAKTGRDIYFTLTIVNDDPASTVGKQTTVLYDVNIDGVTLAKLDAEAPTLDEEVAFTYEDFDLLDEFGNPIV